MQRKPSILLSLIVIIILLVTAVPSTASVWKFVVMSDSYGPTWHADTVNGVNVPAFTRVVNRVNAENVDFVLFPGDAVYGYCNDAELRSQMLTWSSVANNLNCPLYYTPGNHEVNHVSPTSEDVLREFMTHQPLNGPPGHERLVYSFEHKNAHIVSLNSNHYGEAHKIQQAWLEMDLAQATKPHIFVMAHEPAYPIGPHIGNSLDAFPALRDTFWNTLVRYDVRMFFCSHEHFYARRTHNGIYQIHSATCGSPPYPGYADTLPQYHYVVVEINGNNVQCTAKSEWGTVLDTWSYTVEPILSIAEIKALPNGTAVTVRRKLVTAGTDRFSSTFYVQDADRSSGIRVVSIGRSAPTGSLVNFTGTITTVQGERAISCSSLEIIQQNVPLPEPLSMVTKAVGGGIWNEHDSGVLGGVGLHNTGLLVRTCGRVTLVDEVRRNFYIDDGCGLANDTSSKGLLISCGGLSGGATINLPAEGSYVTVTGISSRRPVGETVLPVVRVRTQSDIAVRQP